jgi:hypothetical protein
VTEQASLSLCRQPEEKKTVGKNDGAKRASVCNQIYSSGAMVVCLQETKITSWTYSLLVETVGTDMAQNFVALPSIGASGGILIAVSARFFCLDDPHPTTNTVSASLGYPHSWTSIFILYTS